MKMPMFVVLVGTLFSFYASSGEATRADKKMTGHDLPANGIHSLVLPARSACSVHHARAVRTYTRTNASGRGHGHGGGYNRKLVPEASHFAENPF